MIFCPFSVFFSDKIAFLTKKREKEHSLIYIINDETVPVLVISAYGHYTL